MGGRSRIIKPGFFTDEKIVSLRPEERLLFIGLWCHADREGRLKNRPNQIRLDVFPGTEVDVRSGLDALAGAGLICRYRAEDIDIIQVANFTEHQRPHHREPDSILPAYTGHGCPDHGRTMAMDDAYTDDARAVDVRTIGLTEASDAGSNGSARPTGGPEADAKPTESSANTVHEPSMPHASAMDGALTGDALAMNGHGCPNDVNRTSNVKGKSKNGGGVQGRGDGMPRFSEFWMAYPRRVGRGAAEVAWAKATKSTSAQAIIDGLTRQSEKLTALASRDGGTFCPHPATWLNQKRWEDESTEVPHRGTSRVAIDGSDWAEVPDGTW